MVEHRAHRARETARKLVYLAAFDLPYGAIRRHLIDDRPLPVDLRKRIEPAIRAILASGQ